jgi:AAA15 family ATPase/GTPase
MYKVTKIKSMNVKSFRSLEDVDVKLGSKMTLIAGRNGTSKSTILGILAQICSFEKNYTPSGEEELSYATAYDQDFYTEFIASSIKQQNPSRARARYMQGFCYCFIYLNC